ALTGENKALAETGRFQRLVAGVAASRGSASRPAGEVRRPPSDGRCLAGCRLEGTTMIEVENLSKRYGDKLAVDGLSFVVQPGMV
ncbi:MAG TPA: hypothetical protein VFD94_04855, partial [Jatrophihabitans sp.]|nr:hypothetical protein [Jatrophihabitans sp.]